MTLERPLWIIQEAELERGKSLLRPFYSINIITTIDQLMNLQIWTHLNFLRMLISTDLIRK